MSGRQPPPLATTTVALGAPWSPCRPSPTCGAALTLAESSGHGGPERHDGGQAGPRPKPLLRAGHRANAAAVTAAPEAAWRPHCTVRRRAQSDTHAGRGGAGRGLACGGWCPGRGAPEGPPGEGQGPWGRHSPSPGAGSTGAERSQCPPVSPAVRPARGLRPSGLTRLASPVLPPPFAAALPPLCPSRLCPQLRGPAQHPSLWPSCHSGPGSWNRRGPPPRPVASWAVRNPGVPESPQLPGSPRAWASGVGDGAAAGGLRPVRGRGRPSRGWRRGPGEGDGPGRRQP